MPPHPSSPSYLFYPVKNLKHDGRGKIHAQRELLNLKTCRQTNNKLVKLLKNAK